MRYLTLGEVLKLHADLVATSGGATGVRDLGRIQAALAQPLATFGGEDLYPTVADKAGALGFALVQGHAFIDGNKRIGHAAMEVFLMLNGLEVISSVDEQERTILAVASRRDVSGGIHGMADIACAFGRVELHNSAVAADKALGRCAPSGPCS